MATARTLVLGLGNPILGDDGVGLAAAQGVRESLPPDSPVEVDTDCRGGLHLMERLVGYDRAVIIDAICTGQHRPGAVLQLRHDDLATQHSASAHDVNLPTALRLAATVGLKVPADITIVAIEAENVLDFSEQLSPAVQAALPVAIQAVLTSLGPAAGAAGL